MCILMVRFARSTCDVQILSGVGIAHDWDLLRIGDFRRAVPAFAFWGLHIDLDELREIAAVV
jgi:hypothetical protein